MVRLNKLIHEEARLKILSILAVHDKIDFTALKNELKLTDGNLSTHLQKLEKANYVKITKSFISKKPKTSIQLSEKGRREFKSYVLELETIIGKK